MTKKGVGKGPQRQGLSPAAYGELTRDYIMDFIRDTIADTGESPTLQEIAERIGRAPKNIVHHLKVLIEQGRLAHENAYRGWYIPEAAGKEKSASE